MPVHLTSEIGRLRAVLVHTPGPELLAVTPATREDYLYDDIIDVETAQREHRRFVAIVERFAQVLSVRELGGPGASDPRDHGHRPLRAPGARAPGAAGRCRRADADRGEGRAPRAARENTQRDRVYAPAAAEPVLRP